MRSKPYPHPEERPKGASRRTQGRYAALRFNSCPASGRHAPARTLVHYARNAEIRSRKRGRPLSALTCDTLDEFTSAVAERDATFRALVSNLDAKAVEPVHPP